MLEAVNDGIEAAVPNLNLPRIQPHQEEVQVGTARHWIARFGLALASSVRLGRSWHFICIWVGFDIGMITQCLCTGFN